MIKLTLHRGHFMDEGPGECLLEIVLVHRTMQLEQNLSAQWCIDDSSDAT